MVSLAARCVPVPGKISAIDNGICCEHLFLAADRVFRRSHRVASAAAHLVPGGRRAILHWLSAVPAPPAAMGTEDAGSSDNRCNARILRAQCLGPGQHSVSRVLPDPDAGVGTLPRRTAGVGRRASGSRPTVARSLAALIGLVLVVAPVFIYTKGTAFPGLAALPPCLGTAAIIWAGMASSAAGSNTVSRLLGLRPVVFVGLISYSLYLWHWPLLVLARHLTVSVHLDQPTAIATIAVATLAAIASWRLIERPFRNRALWGRMAVFTAAGAGAAAVAAAAVGIVVLQGVPSRFDPTVVQLEAGGGDFSKKGDACLNKPLMNGEIMPACRLLGRPDGPVEFLLWGDSHAGSIVPAFDVLAERTGMTGRFSTRPGCPPLTDVVFRAHASDRKDCWQHNNNTLEFAVSAPSVRLVLLEWNWNACLRDPAFVQMSSNGEETRVGERGLELFLQGLERTIERLSSAGKRVVILDNLPEPGFPVPWTLAMLTLTHTPWPRVPSPNEPSERLRTIFKKYDVIDIRMDEAICAKAVCKVAEGANTIFSDDNHLSDFGARTIYAPFLYDRLFGPNGAIKMRASTFGSLTNGRAQ